MVPRPWLAGCISTQQAHSQFLFVCLVFSCIGYFYYHCDQNAWRNILWKEGLILAHSFTGVSLLYWERHGRHTSSHHDKPGSRKQARSGEGVGTGLCPLIPCSPLFHLCFQPMRWGWGWVFPSQLILWNQRWVFSNVIIILNPATLTLKKTHHMGDVGDGTLALTHAGKLANIEACQQLLTHSQQSAILRVTAFISCLHT